MLDAFDEDVNAGLIPTVALSVYAPWAYAMLFLGKDVENRGWKQPSRTGARFWIHAAKPKSEAHALEQFQLMAKTALCAKERVRIDVLDVCRKLEGKIVGRARIGRVVDTSSSPWFVGPYGYEILEVERLLEQPVEARGMPGFWKVGLELMSKLKASSLAEAEAMRKLRRRRLPKAARG